MKYRQLIKYFDKEDIKLAVHRKLLNPERKSNHTAGWVFHEDFSTIKRVVNTLKADEIVNEWVIPNNA